MRDEVNVNYYVVISLHLTGIFSSILHHFIYLNTMFVIPDVQPTLFCPRADVSDMI